VSAPAFADHPERSRFELIEDGHLAFASYRIEGGIMQIPYVEAAVPLRGAGAAGRLMERVASAACVRGLKVVPLCGYAVSWFRRHPEHRDLLA
jgi:predicted GNAT family acetyltransferase